MDSARTGADNDNLASGKTGTSALRNGIKVLQIFSREEPVLGVNEIARRVGLHNSTVSRTLATLEDTDLVERDPSTGKFRLGVGVIALASPMLANLDVRRVARPFLEELTRETEETSALVVWSEIEAIGVEQIASPRKVKHTVPLGTRYRYHASSTVKVFLAEASRDEVEQFLDRGMAPLSERTIVNREEYRNTLRRVKELGYAVNDGETSLEEVGVAAPIRDHRDRVLAAVLVSAPRYRTPQERLEKLGTRVKRAADEISEWLGGANE